MKLRILALDTAAASGGIALVEDGRIVEEVPLRSDDGFAHVLYGPLGTLLARHGWATASIDCFASAAGPGSFTGVRVGLAAIKGLAEAVGRPMVAVSNLQALAWFGSGALRATVIDARRGEVYGAVYDRALEVAGEAVVSPLRQWLETLPEAAIEFIAADGSWLRGLLAGTRFESSGVLEAGGALAGVVGLIAHRRFVEGGAVDPVGVDAEYVRRSDAEMYWKEP